MRIVRKRSFLHPAITMSGGERLLQAFVGPEHAPEEDLKASFVERDAVRDLKSGGEGLNDVMERFVRVEKDSNCDEGFLRLQN